MRTRPGAVRVRATVVASALIALLGLVLSGCSGDDADAVTSPSAVARPTAPATPVPTTTSTLRKATASAPLNYVALGDSYSSGMGGGKEVGPCRRSPNGYPHLLAKEKTIELTSFPACAGATTKDVLKKQLDVLDPSVDLVTITIGGNDLDVGALPVACAKSQTKRCKAAVTASVDLLNTLQPKLDKTYQAIAKAAPNARILVAGYPAFFDLPDLEKGNVNTDELSAAVAADTAVASLDATIETAVVRQRNAGTDIHFVDVSFLGHGVNSTKPWFVLHGVDAYHPTAAGYKQYALTLHDYLG
ncbi:SGNH/GDSL hydrolase family protein [Humibacter sp. RRB41]|uniref:SGNH/GDSL hydrolase family protein n=1 Tax=Humibacter sp. RRB41 TaxID=2919946 RepID=UPI001FAB2BFD|nr:SGNH/GDSL hydrolase family protein [Humibacter sp. RRB41]